MTYPQPPQRRSVVSQYQSVAPPPMMPMVVQPAVPSSSTAVWALVLGIVGLVAGWCLLGIPCIAAVLLGHVGVNDTRNNVKSGRGMAVAGLVMGYVGVLPAIILFFWMVLGGAAAVFAPSTIPTPTPSY